MNYRFCHDYHTLVIAIVIVIIFHALHLNVTFNNIDQNSSSFKFNSVGIRNALHVIYVILSEHVCT